MKVNAYLRQHLGYKDVGRLEHGIIGYQRWLGESDVGSANGDESVEAPETEQSEGCIFTGSNFVFDRRTLA